MTDESQQVPLQPEPSPVTPPQIPDPVTSTTQKSKKKTWVIVGIVLGVLLLCSIVCVAVFGTSLYKVLTEKAPVEAVLDAYMQHMVNEDVESAYALFSPRAQRQIPISKVQEMLEGNNYFLFEGYQSLTLSNLNISAAVNTNPDVPQGTVANVTGVIIFEGDIQGSFTGILEKVDGEWMIDAINITVPPGKIK